jgi:hypothetical protein
MTATRALILIPVMLLVFMASDSSAAQGRGKFKGNGPAFCRNGQGHPVHGWEWCEDKGWGRSRTDVVRRNGRDRIVDASRRSGAGRRANIAFEQGYADGYDKGLEDAGRNRDYDPARHSWYRNADRGYEDEYGTKAAYKNVYRESFRDGYEAGYRHRERNDNRNTRGSGTAVRRRWPF